jgi:hypothetical protein
MHKGVKCLEVSTGRIYISRDIVFDENIFSFASLHPNAGALLRKEILLLPNHLDLTNRDMNDVDYMPNHCNPMPAASPLQIGAENLEQNGEKTSQNKQETEAHFMPEDDAVSTGSDPKSDWLTGARSGEESPGSADPESASSSSNMRHGDSTPSPSKEALSGATTSPHQQHTSGPASPALASQRDVSSDPSMVPAPAPPDRGVQPPTREPSTGQGAPVTGSTASAPNRGAQPPT